MLKWTTESPKKPGLYFHRLWIGGPIELLQVARIGYWHSTDGFTRLVVVYPMSTKTAIDYVDRMGGEWASTITIEKITEDKQ